MGLLEEGESAYFEDFEIGAGHCEVCGGDMWAARGSGVMVADES
jgi:hypothetical protein